MGSKNGKYDFENQNSPNDLNETLPALPLDLNRSVIKKKSESSVPKCIHRDVLIDSTNTENLSLVWLDTHVRERASNIDTEIKLKNVIQYIRVFNRVEECEKYIKQIGKLNNNEHIKKERLLIVISTTLAPTIIPHLHDLPQVKFIYIFGKAKTISKAHQDWLRKFNKVNPKLNFNEIILYLLG
jgi:hypothetical protein